MACLLKAPKGPAKGCAVFTTQERDHLILQSADVRAQIQALKTRYVIGLHHNWHDHDFHYDPLFDFSMAGDGDLIEQNGRDFARVPLDACNFSPACYSAPRTEPFWDILYVARAVNFKGIPEFFAAIRALYDAGHKPRVLFICPTPEKIELPGIVNLRRYFESQFNLEERKRVILMTLDWDYPFPLDAETLAHFYRSSRIFFHAASLERRCRTAAYAWAGRMPVVATANVASILPLDYRRPPFLYAFEGPEGMAEALKRALEDDPSSDQWSEVVAEFSAEQSAQRVALLLDGLASRHSWGQMSCLPINGSLLDIRLGRHHGLSIGDNRIEMSLGQFSKKLLSLRDEELQRIAASADPEKALGPQCGSEHPIRPKAEMARPLGRRIADLTKGLLRI